jgi:hypothetical protein
MFSSTQLALDRLACFLSDPTTPSSLADAILSAVEMLGLENKTMARVIDDLERARDKAQDRNESLSRLVARHRRIIGEQRRFIKEMSRILDRQAAIVVQRDETIRRLRCELAWHGLRAARGGVVEHERRQKWICHEILHDGDGPRGKRVVVVSFLQTVSSPEEAAEAAAAQLNAWEAQREGYDCQACAFNGGSVVIEVETETGVQRFRVRCRLEMKYYAEKE